MSSAQRPQPPAVIDRLLAQPHEFGFFQAVRMLDRWLARSEAPGSASTGLAPRIAFRNSLSLAFPASEIERLSLHADAQSDGREPPVRASARVDARAVRQVEITPAFIGLLGAAGAMPIHYTEVFARRELFQRDRSARAFLDIFLHRSTVLFYQSWRKHRLHVQFEGDRRHRYLPLVLSLAGLGHPGLHRRLRGAQGGVADDTLAFFAGALQQRPTSAITLQRVVAHYFGIDVRVEQFVGRWFDLPKAHQSHLGVGRTVLGRDALVGERVWQRNLRLRIVLGPLDRDKFERFLPGGQGALALDALLKMLAGPTFEFEVKLSLKAAAVRGTRLDGRLPARLGFDSYLITRASPVDREDVAYDLGTSH